MFSVRYKIVVLSLLVYNKDRIPYKKMNFSVLFTSVFLNKFKVEFSSRADKP